jgi:hypothetical protein
MAEIGRASILRPIARRRINASARMSSSPWAWGPSRSGLPPKESNAPAPTPNPTSTLNSSAITPLPAPGPKTIAAADTARADAITRTAAKTVAASEAAEKQTAAASKLTSIAPILRGSQTSKSFDDKGRTTEIAGKYGSGSATHINPIDRKPGVFASMETGQAGSLADATGDRASIAAPKVETPSSTRNTVNALPNKPPMAGAAPYQPVKMIPPSVEPTGNVLPTMLRDTSKPVGSQLSLPPGRQPAPAPAPTQPAPQPLTDKGGAAADKVIADLQGMQAKIAPLPKKKVASY